MTGAGHSAKAFAQIAVALVVIVLCAEGLKRLQTHLVNLPESSLCLLAGFKTAFGAYDSKGCGRSRQP